MPPKLKIVYYVEPDVAALAQRAARFMVEAVEQAAAKRGRARIAISGGSAPKAVFALLADPSQIWRARMPWDRIELYWVDERCVPPDHPASNYRMTREALLDHVPLPEGQIYRMEGELEPEVAAARYESMLRNSFRLEGAETPPFDLIHLGLGTNGHTASLFPHSPALHEIGRLAAANHVDDKVPWRVTLTWPVINEGAQVFFLAGGADKAGILKEVFLGTNDPERLPSQLIRPASGILTLLLDRTAAALLPPVGGDGCGFFEREE